MDDPHPEKYPSGKLIYGIAALATLLLIVMCAKPDPTPREHVARSEKSEVDCTGMTELDCWNAKQFDKRRTEMAQELEKEGFFDK